MRLPFAAATVACVMTSHMAMAADAPVEILTDAPEIEVNDDKSGFYIAARLGAAFAEDTDFALASVPSTVNNSYEDTSITGGLALGYRINEVFSAEIEAGYSEQDISSHTFEALPATYSGDDAFGSTSVTYGLFNVTAAYETGTALRPYLSAGVGLAEVEFDSHGAVLPTGDFVAMNDSDLGVAWQLGAGVIIDITDKLSLEGGYRYFNVSNLDLTATDGTKSGIDLGQHQALFGIRYAF